MSGPKNKERFVPFLGRLQSGFGRLRGMLLGRVARLNEMELSERDRVAAMVEDFQELVMEK